MHGVLNETYLQNFLHKGAGAGAVFRGAGALPNDPPRTAGASSTPSSWATSNFFPTFILFSISVVPTFFPKNDSEYYA